MKNAYMLCKTALVLMMLSFGLTIQIRAQQSAPAAGGSPVMNYSRGLLKRPDVQKELGIDANQKEALAKVLSKSDLPILVHPVVKYRDISKLSDEERKQWQAEINRQAARETAYIMNEQRREVEEILRPDQRKRLTQIDLQFRGILALGDKSLSDRLGVSPAHQQRVAEILADFKAKRLKLLSSSEESENTNSLRYQERLMLLQEAEQKVLAVLSDEEKALWSQAIGKLFKFEENFK